MSGAGQAATPGQAATADAAGEDERRNAEYERYAYGKPGVQL